MFAHVSESGNRMHQHIPFPFSILGPKYEYRLMQLIGLLSEMDWLYRFRVTRWIVDKLGNRLLIPIIHGEVVTMDEIESLVRQLEKEGHPIYIGICECRHGENRIETEMVDGHDPNYTCVMIGDWGRGHIYSYPGYYKSITADELLEQTRFWYSKDRVLNAWGISASHGFVISYCHCQPEYCIPLRHQFKRGDKVFLPGYNYAVIDQEKCLGAGECERDCSKHCWFNAISVVGGKPVVDREKCHGCGQCFSFCPSDAATAVRKENFELFFCTDDLVHPESRTLPASTPAKMIAEKTGEVEEVEV